MVPPSRSIAGRSLHRKTCLAVVAPIVRSSSRFDFSEHRGFGCGRAIAAAARRFHVDYIARVHDGLAAGRPCRAVDLEDAGRARFAAIQSFGAVACSGRRRIERPRPVGAYTELDDLSVAAAAAATAAGTTTKLPPAQYDRALHFEHVDRGGADAGRITGRARARFRGACAHSAGKAELGRHERLANVARTDPLRRTPRAGAITPLP